ncbi:MULTISPECIES: tRNA epoxyqueuosine(34) reductase QueG [unclassified Nitrospina]|uniref:tRNA epoxyqueuosine(34) reductase QueG n=1 Tax=unclassified Nitrospina TaxID=2638683 RepID=UPI003F952533
MHTATLPEKMNALRDRARELGFDALGVAPPDVGEDGERFLEWLDRGHGGEMAYMKRGEAKRLDPALILPGVQSILCLRTNYHTRAKSLDFLNQPQTGDISNYAWNVDYHDLIKPRLHKLEHFLWELFPGCASKAYVDTGPVLEKALAQKSGLGWIGKHSNLLTEGLGSYYFLSEILIDVALPLSEPATDHCGTCTSCIDICPTRAIVAPYVLDARRCISYLTIELKGVIPLEFRRALGNRIYGCDDCQIVCPWNSYAVTTDEPAFQERDGTRLLIDLMRLDEDGFRERFRKSPVKRIKRRGLLRNAAVALGNSGDPQAVPVLLEALCDPEPLIRAHAVWALGELLGNEAWQAVQGCLTGEADPAVLTEIERLKPVDNLGGNGL